MSSDTLFGRLKRNCMVVFLAAGMLFSGVSAANAVDFKAKGQWIVGFGLGNTNFIGGNGIRKDDLFSAAQRIRLKLDAVASENLSGTVYFEIGQQDWGNNTDSSGGALGADGNAAIKIKNAYIDWLVPETDLRIRMGLQGVALPHAAGGSPILDGDVAGVTMNYRFNDNASLTAFWLRPVNDNFQGRFAGDSHVHYLDNIDYFGLTVPLNFDGFEITPWLAYGMLGKNALEEANGWGGAVYTADGDLTSTLYTYIPSQGGLYSGFGSKSQTYSDSWFFGLPISVTALDPLKIEFDVNYGYVQGFGKTDIFNYKNRAVYGNGDVVRADTKREGWMIKALVEYKMDWGVPGLFGWYSSGDDGDVKNGSERLPSLAGCSTFTSTMGAAGSDFWAANSKGLFYENSMTYAGTWGVGLQIRDMSFLEELSHTFRVAYWGGTNSPDMVKYVSYSGAGATEVSYDGPYLTSNDGLVEFNLDNKYKIYENLAVELDLGYIVNMMDRGTWARSWTKRGYGDGPSFSQHDGWKAQLNFNYTF